jgi:3-hydroxyisobutyrate dehydrogenase-like beta-hydroxyacid dehydrogenase
MKLTMLGLGDEASLIAQALAARGVDVIANDPAKPKFPVVPFVDSIENAVGQADVVFALNSSLASLISAQTAAPALRPGVLYCDLNATTPDLKKRIAATLPEGSFVDVAIMGSIPDLAEKVPLSVSGAGAQKFIEVFGKLGLNLTYVSEQAGDAAARGQLRSLLANGISAAIIDVLWAAKELGLEHWALAEIQNQLETGAQSTVQKYLDNAGRHAKRLSVELGDTVELLASVGYESTTINGIAATLSKAMHNVKIPFANLED